MEEKGHVIEILEKAKKAIAEKDTNKIRELSNQTIHTASIYQDPDNISIAVVLYALSKAIERPAYHEYKDWPKFEKAYKESIDNAIIALKNDEIEVYREQIDMLREKISKLSGNLKKYIEDVFRKASINKASRLYEHGISAEKTASILGITLWELNEYTGKTGIADVNFAYTVDLNKRIKMTEDIFKK